MSRETFIGIISVITIGIAVWGFNWLKRNDVFTSERIFYAEYSSVDGLTKDRPVTLNGFQVGSVRDVYFNPNGSGNLIVSFVMKEDFPITKNATAQIFALDLLGTKAIQLVLAEGELAENGDTLLGKTDLTLQETVNREVAPIKKKAEELLNSLDTVLVYVQALLNKESRDRFENTFIEVEQTFTALQQTILAINRVVTGNEDSFNNIVVHLDSITATLEESEEDYARTISNIATLSDSLAGMDLNYTVEKMNSLLGRIDSITARIEAGEGTMGKLSKDDALYDNLASSTKELSELLYDLKMNPSRYVRFSVFGGNKSYEEPVEEESEKE